MEKLRRYQQVRKVNSLMSRLLTQMLLPLQRTLCTQACFPRCLSLQKGPRREASLGLELLTSSHHSFHPIRRKILQSSTVFVKLSSSSPMHAPPSQTDPRLSAGSESDHPRSSTVSKPRSREDQAYRLSHHELIFRDGCGSW